MGDAAERDIKDAWGRAPTEKRPDLAATLALKPGERYLPLPAMGCGQSGLVVARGRPADGNKVRPSPSPATQWRISGSLARVGDWSCGGATRGQNEPREHDWPTAAFSTAGVYSVHCARGRALVDPLQVLFLNAGESYETRSTEADPCSGLSLALSPSVIHEVFGKDTCPRLATTCPPALVAKVARLARGLPDADAFDEAALGIAATLSSARHGEPNRSPKITPRSARLVDEVRSVLASRLRERLPLTAIAASLGVSAFHLCRVFHASTGETIHRALTRMRVMAAIEPVLDGVDLTALSFELGFASQSHFGAAFKREIGTSPSRFRREVGPQQPRARTL